MSEMNRRVFEALKREGEGEEVIPEIERTISKRNELNELAEESKKHFIGETAIRIERIEREKRLENLAQCPEGHDTRHFYSWLDEIDELKKEIKVYERDLHECEMNYEKKFLRVQELESALEERVKELEDKFLPGKIEEYIRSLQWKGNPTETETALVAGNIRAFAQYLRETKTSDAVKILHKRYITTPEREQSLEDESVIADLEKKIYDLESRLQAERERAEKAEEKANACSATADQAIDRVAALEARLRGVQEIQSCGECNIDHGTICPECARAIKAVSTPKKGER